MARINLLPWREESRRQQNQQFYLVFFLSEMSCTLLLAALYFSIQHYTQRERNNIHFLEETQKTSELQTKRIEAFQKDKALLLTRLQIIQSLQEQRLKVVKLLDSLPRVVPEGVCLTGFTRKQDSLFLEGQANTHASISRLLKNLESKEAAGLFQEIKLKEILMNKKESRLQFKIQFKLNITAINLSHEDLRHNEDLGN